MEGKYGLYRKDEPFDKHTHVLFHFTDGTELRYRDVRKFGTMHLYKKGDEFLTEPLIGLGPELRRIYRRVFGRAKKRLGK